MPATEWPSHGALNFPIDPAFSSAESPAIWRATDNPTIIVISAGQPGATWTDSVLADYSVQAERFSDAGRHLVLADDLGIHRLLVQKPGALAQTGFFVPDDKWLTIRLKALSRFRASNGPLARAMAKELRPSAYQRFRLERMLAILDRMDGSSPGGRTMRDIAAQILFPNAEPVRAIEWKTSSERRQTQRLVAEARRYMFGDYRTLLNGSMGKQTASKVD